VIVGVVDLYQILYEKRNSFRKDLAMEFTTRIL